MELSKSFIILNFVKKGNIDNYYGVILYSIKNFILEHSDEGYKFYNIEDKNNYTQDKFFEKYREELLKLC